MKSRIFVILLCLTLSFNFLGAQDFKNNNTEQPTIPPKADNKPNGTKPHRNSTSPKTDPAKQNEEERLRLEEENRRLEEERAKREEEQRRLLEEQKYPKVMPITVKGVTFDMIRVDEGTYRMGSTDKGCEAPVHDETVARFYICSTEVTQALWEAVMGKEKNQSKFKGANLPVVYVSWDNCQKFIEKLNELTDREFRLPTEAEWEYAARGGNLTQHYIYSGSDEIDTVAWFNEDWRSGSTHPVGEKGSNELGIFDMSGNVSEWCNDKWCEDYSKSRDGNRVIRGGSFLDKATNCRVTSRANHAQNYLHYNLGLRLAMTP